MDSEPVGWPSVSELSRIVNDIANGAAGVSWDFEVTLTRLSKMIREMYGDWSLSHSYILAQPDKTMVRVWTCKLRITLIPMLKYGRIGVAIEAIKFAEPTTVFRAGIPFNKPPFTARLKEILETFEHGLRGDS